MFDRCQPGDARRQGDYLPPLFRAQLGEGAELFAPVGGGLIDQLQQVLPARGRGVLPFGVESDAGSRVRPGLVEARARVLAGPPAAPGLDLMCRPSGSRRASVLPCPSWHQDTEVAEGRFSDYARARDSGANACVGKLALLMGNCVTFHMRTGPEVDVDGGVGH